MNDVTPAYSIFGVWYRLLILPSHFAGLVGVIAFIVIAGVHTLHINLTVIDLIRQRGFQEQFDFSVLHRATLHRQQIVILVHLAPINHLMEFFFSMASSHSRVLRPFPSRKGWATFISTYLAIISSNVDCGILLMFSRAEVR